MPKVSFILRGGTERTVEATAGISLMEAAVNAGVRGIHGDCSGCCQCATCHVYIEVAADRLPLPKEEEDEMLEGVAAERLPNSRLSCQVMISEALDGLVVRVPETQ